MAKPKDPSDKPVKAGEAPPPERSGEEPIDPLAGLPLQAMIEAIATAAGQLKGLQGPELKRAVNEAVFQIQGVANQAAAQNQAEEARIAAAAEVQRMLDIFARTSAGVSDALAPHRNAIASMFQNVSIDKIADGLRVISDYMKSPTPQNEATAKKLFDDLQATMGPVMSYDPAAADEERRAQIRADVQSRLDKIFRPEKK